MPKLSASLGGWGGTDRLGALYECRVFRTELPKSVRWGQLVNSSEGDRCSPNDGDAFVEGNPSGGSLRCHYCGNVNRLAGPKPPQSLSSAKPGSPLRGIFCHMLLGFGKPDA